MSSLSDITPSRRPFSITPSDSTVIVGPTGQRPKAIYVGTGGTVVTKTENDASVTFVNFPSGAVLPVVPDYILETSGASDFVGL